MTSQLGSDDRTSPDLDTLEPGAQTPAAPQPAPRTEALKAARTPVGVGLSPAVAQIVALILIGLGVLAVQDALVRTGLAQTQSWLRAVVEATDAVEASAWMIAPFVALIILGLLILPIAFRRRPRKAVSLTARTGVYLRTKDVASIVKTRLEGVDAVVDVSAAASRSRIKVKATSLAPADRNATIESDIRDRMAPVLGALERAPRLTVDIRNEKFS